MKTKCASEGQLSTGRAPLPNRRKFGSWPNLRFNDLRLERQWSRSTLPLLEGSLSLSSLADLAPASAESPEDDFRSTSDGSHQRIDEADVNEDAYKMAGIVALAFGVLSVVPYNMILQSDPNSPLCISFATHIFFVVVNVMKFNDICFHRKIPLVYHAGFVALGFLFTTFKSNAFTRLPASFCMLLLNLQMPVAMLMQYIIFGDRYSRRQIFACALVVLGVMIGGNVTKKSTRAENSIGIFDGAILGVLQMMVALVALTALSMLVKVAFSRFGEAVQEQLVMQHLGALPLFFFGGQWGDIGPRFTAWVTGEHKMFLSLLLVNMAVTFVSRAAQARFAGRAPNLILVHLVATVQKFATILVTALMAAPPFPPATFWVGSVVLVLGTLMFLMASEGREAREERDAKKRK
eukprot:TRINITY_DN2790_c0_g2_i1.p1 TRINITY_DN2790_c0_g2~~TRINITY_DN2790_c0_g2_i1.p1  ORF type:complete len:407 (-),score=44.43 TRINITY_DN2790_c0_g2_i1:303-1523(-)